MKSLFWLAASALALAGCAPAGPPAARATLDCPANQGDLRRVSIAPDQKSCAYTSRDGDEVDLRLVPVVAGPQAALQPIETELQTEIGPEPAEPSTPAADANQAEDEAKTDAAKADKAGHGGEHTQIDLPGIHIDAQDNKANVSVGTIHVDAGDKGAVIRMTRDVRLRGEAFSRVKRGFRATYILARDNLKDGYKAVGYEAGGPKTGPLTVALVKSKSGDHHDIFSDVKRLVRRNGGV